MAQKRSVMMIRVQVVLYANFRKYHPQNKGIEPAEVTLAKNSTIKDLIKILKIPDNENVQAFVDNYSRPLHYHLTEECRVALFPPIAGG